MEADRIKWNRRFASEDSFLGERPSPFLLREIERIKLLAPGLTALDIASGEGRNSIFLAQHGFIVTALDISDVGISKGKMRATDSGVQIFFRQMDLDGYKFTEKYDLIINFNFLSRKLITKEVTALNPGGLLLFDTIIGTSKMLAEHNPDYFLVSGELMQIFSQFDGDILFDEESDLGDVPTARLIFRKAA